MRIGQGLSSLDLYKLFTEHIEKQRLVPPVQPQQGQQGQPGRLTFQFNDSFETSANGAQQWLVRREVAEAPEVGGPKGQKAQASARVSRTLFSDGFESARTPPVDLGQHRSTVNRFQQSLQDNGFHASVNDL